MALRRPRVTSEAVKLPERIRAARVVEDQALMPYGGSTETCRPRSLTQKPRPNVRWCRSVPAAELTIEGGHVREPGGKGNFGNPAVRLPAVAQQPIHVLQPEPQDEARQGSTFTLEQLVDV